MFYGYSPLINTSPYTGVFIIVCVFSVYCRLQLYSLYKGLTTSLFCSSFLIVYLSFIHSSFLYSFLSILFSTSYLGRHLSTFPFSFHFFLHHFFYIVLHPVGWCSSNSPDLYSGGARFEFQQGHLLS